MRRFWPETGREEPLPVFFDRILNRLPVTVFPGGKEIAFFGTYTNTGSRAGIRGIYALDLDSKRARAIGRAFGGWRGNWRPISAAPDGKSLITLVRNEDIDEVVKLPRDGAPGCEVLLSVPAGEIVWVSVGPDNSIYVDDDSNPDILLQFSPGGGIPDEYAVARAAGEIIGSLGDGKLLFSSLIGGREHLVAGLPGAEALPFLQTTEESYPPFAGAAGTVAFLLGTPPRQQLAIANVREGRVLRRLSIAAAGIRTVALSPDGQTLYYTVGGSVWSLPVSESAAPRRIAEGDDVAADPGGRFLYVMQRARDPVVLARVPIAGGASEPIPIPEGLYPTPNLMTAGAVDARGRVLFVTNSPDSSFTRIALYDPARKAVTPIDVRFEGGVFSAVWTPDGRIAGFGARQVGVTIWRYHAPKQP